MRQRRLQARPHKVGGEVIEFASAYVGMELLEARGAQIHSPQFIKRRE